ncbi:hypothetical protein [Tabrizicola sp.]|uniref:hypothetical protein n=1 Tax=Tabrizicola sp. TaxID=2005166 RepID=UPI003F3F59DA
MIALAGIAIYRIDMAELLEFLTLMLAMAIYGSEKHPRHPAIRNSIRIIAFAGSAVALAIMLGLVADIRVPLIVTVLWGLAGLIVLMAEHELGDKRIAVAAWLTGAALLGVGLWQGF